LKGEKPARDVLVDPVSVQAFKILFPKGRKRGWPLGRKRKAETNGQTNP